MLSLLLMLRFCAEHCEHAHLQFTCHFVMVPVNMTYLHFLQHFLFEHLFNLYCHIKEFTSK